MPSKQEENAIKLYSQYRQSLRKRKWTLQQKLKSSNEETVIDEQLAVVETKLRELNRDDFVKNHLLEERTENAQVVYKNKLCALKKKKQRWRKQGKDVSSLDRQISFLEQTQTVCISEYITSGSMEMENFAKKNATTPATPRPVETPSSTILQQLPPTPQMTPKQAFAMQKLQALSGLAATNDRSVEVMFQLKNERDDIRNDINRLDWEEEESSSPKRDLAEEMESVAIKSPSPARTIAAQPFPSDKWSIKSKSQFESLIAQFVVTLQSIRDPGEWKKLCARFLSFLRLEHESYFDSFFGNPDCPNAQYVMKGLHYTTAKQVKDGLDAYIACFVEGKRVKYRKLDGDGKFIELVDVEIVAADSGAAHGAFTIAWDGKEKATTIDRLQPDAFD